MDIFGVIDNAGNVVAVFTSEEDNLLFGSMTMINGKECRLAKFPVLDFFREALHAPIRMYTVKATWSPKPDGIAVPILSSINLHPDSLTASVAPAVNSWDKTGDMFTLRVTAPDKETLHRLINNFFSSLDAIYK